MPPVGKIATLPEWVREWLHQAIVERAYGDIVGLTDELNAMCKEGGVAMSIGKSAVGAEALRIKRATESIRVTTQACRAIAESAKDDGDMRSEAVMAMVQEGMFEALMKAREAESAEDPGEALALMGQAALAVSRISRTRVNQARWRDELDLRTKAAADQVAKIARKGGLDSQTVDAIRASILGIVPRPAATPGAP